MGQVSRVECKEKGERMKNKIVVLTISALIFALSGSSHAQQPKKVPRIGYVTAGGSE